MLRRLSGGLRGRLTIALVFTSAVTLVIAALTLFGPLEGRLRRSDIGTLAEAAATARPSFTEIDRQRLRPADPELTRLTRSLQRRTGAQVAVVDAQGRVLAGTDLDGTEQFPVALRALRDQRLQRGTVVTDGSTDAQVAAPIRADGGRIAIVLRKPLTEVHAAAGVIRRGFAVAAAAGLVASLLLGLLIAGRLVRRLRVLRDTALTVSETGPMADPHRVAARDEVGDLARAFARMQERLSAQEEARRTFVATASHELRTPLATLQMTLDLLKDDVAAGRADADEIRERVERAEMQTERLGRLAADLLDLSRIDAGLALRSEPVDLAALCRAVAGELEVRTGLDGTSITVEPSPPAWALADPRAVAQIARILLDNALRHGPPAQPVDVEIAGGDDAVSVTVRDRGPGVPAAERERIFERFVRGSAATSVTGSGLGLAIGRELARRMGGDLSLDEQCPTGCFVLRLPAAPASAHAAPAAP